MARSGGTYTAPSNSFNPAVEGETIDEAAWNETLTDLESALTESVYTGGMGATDNQLVRTDGTDTKKVQGTGITVDDSNNVSGVASVATTTIELGHATDTTLARSGAGDITIEGNAVYRAGGTDVAIADGGTGAGTAAAGFRALAEGVGSTQGDILYRSGTEWTALGTGTVGEVLRAGGAGANPAWATVAGTGDVTAASNFGTDNVLVRSDGTSKGVQSTGITVDDSNNVSGVASVATTTIELGHATDTTLTRSAAGRVAVEGVDLALDTFTQTGTGAVAATIDAKLRALGAYATVDFGAVGDGVADDTDALQALFDRGGFIYVPTGTYLVTKASLEALAGFGLKPADGSTIVFAADAWIKLESGVDVRHIIAGTTVNDVVMMYPNLDGNDSAANGIGFSNASRFHIIGPQVKNFAAAAQETGVATALGGGRAITFQYDCDGVVVDGLRATDCFTAIDVTGKITGPSRSIVVSNVTAENCNVIMSALSTDSDGLTSTLSELSTAAIVVENVSFYNCGSSTGLDNRVNFSFVRQNSTGNAFPWMTPARTGTTFSTQDWLMDTYSAGDTEWDSTASYNAADRVKYTNTGLDSCLFAIDQSAGVSISGVRGYNTSAYGQIGAVLRGLMKNVSLSNVVVSVDCEYIFRNGPVPILSATTRSYGRGQNIKIRDVDNLGVTDYILGSDGPIDVSNPLTPYYLTMEGIGIQATGNLGLVTTALGSLTTGSAATVWIQARNLSAGGTIAGTPTTLAQRAITDCGVADPQGHKTVIAGGFHVIQYQSANQLRLERTGSNAGAANLYADAGGLNVDKSIVIPTHAWNSNLLRLGTYRLWVDGTGDLRIKGGSNPSSDTDGTIVGTQS